MLLDFTDVPESLRRMVSDYKINVVEIRHFLHSEVFRTDVRQVFDFIRLSENKEALWKLVTESAAYKNMEDDAFDVIAAYADSGELRAKLEEQRQEANGKGAKRDMCMGLQRNMRLLP